MTTVAGVGVVTEVVMFAWAQRYGSRYRKGVPSHTRNHTRTRLDHKASNQGLIDGIHIVNGHLIAS